MRPYDAPIMLPPVLTPSVTTTPTPKTIISSLGGRVAEPRALKSRAFSGEDINYYFDKYFEHFHPHFPIIRSRDPDKCYESAPILFWTIIVIAARRFAKDDTVLPFLTESLTAEVWGTMGNPPLPLGVINALLLLCAWPFTTIRFMRDPSMIFSSIAMSSCFMIGLHTGRGEHPELANPNFQIRNTDEEATFTWAGFNIISQRVSSYTGSPSTGQFFNKTIETILDRSSPVPVPLNFIILLECARFSNRVSKTTTASLEENRGISHHIVDMFEEEFDKVQRLLFPGISELDYFTLLSTLQDVQAFYFMPVTGFSSEIFKRNVLKAYSTAQLVFSSRLGTSFAFDYIRRWKRDIEASRSSVTNANGKRQATGTPTASIDLSTIQPENAQLIDWDAFMDDFDWSFTPDYFNPT
ncbi:hypothetical protein SEUCBS140593_009723 [Sporothrix eucalyptigena]|uniref:C6 zinc finger domain containing protein n=1 Tax=Sporothrix eucalyptigena TaxID=1812306 RepID=A0ABP0CZZ0_9PEZI